MKALDIFLKSQGCTQDRGMFYARCKGRLLWVHDRERRFTVTVVLPACLAVGSINVAPFLKNPVVYRNHQHWKLPIGRGTTIIANKEQLKFDVIFASVPDNGNVYKRYAKAELRDWSIGFVPTGWTGIRIKMWKLLEVSTIE